MQAYRGVRQNYTRQRATTDEGWDKLDIERSAAQPAIYLFFMVLGQLGTSLTAWLAFEYEWQYIHYL
mgnify:CR=1 FL=1